MNAESLILKKAEEKELQRHIDEWRKIPNQVIKYAHNLADTYLSYRCCKDQLEGVKLWVSPIEKGAFVLLSDSDKGLEKISNVRDIVSGIHGVEWLEYSWKSTPDTEEHPWVKFSQDNQDKFNNPGLPDDLNIDLEMEPKGVQPIKFMSQLGGWTKSPINPNPNPLTATLASGLLGAGLGYGTGWLGEKLFKDYVNKGRFRKAMAILGGLGGAAPGLIWGASRVANGRPLFKSSKAMLEAMDHFPELQEKQSAYKSAYDKTANAFAPTINVDNFNSAVWSPADQSTPLGQRAVVSSLVTAAGENRGSNWVSPADVGRIAVGAGVGMLSGMLVGKALGALAGLNRPAQKKLQQVGLWSGVIGKAVPAIFN